MVVTSSGTAVVTLPTDTQILIRREFDAPKHLVYRAWTTPDLIKRWWSGERGEVEVFSTNLRVEGERAQRLHGTLPRNGEREGEGICERLAAVRECSPHDLSQEREVVNLRRRSIVRTQHYDR